MKYRIIIIFLIGVFLSSCANEVKNSLEAVPKAFGDANTITVLADEILWKGPIGDTLNFYYSAAYPITPAPEPLYDIKHFTPQQLNKDRIFSQYRTYLVLANLGDKSSQTTQMVIKDIGEEKYRQALNDPNFNSLVGKNKWAQGQIVIYLFAPSESQLVDVVKKKFSDVSSRIYDHDYKQIYNTAYASGKNELIQNDIKKLYNISLQIPKRMVLAKLDPGDEVMWLREDEKDCILNLVIMKFPYNDQSQFELDSLIDYMEYFGKNHLDDGRMVINNEDLPTYEINRSNEGMFVKEVRGIWEYVNAFKGGPYNTHAVLLEGSDELIILYSFVYAPGKRKRDFMQRLEVIMNTASPIQEN